MWHTASQVGQLIWFLLVYMIDRCHSWCNRSSDCVVVMVVAVVDACPGARQLILRHVRTTLMDRWCELRCGAEITPRTIPTGDILNTLSLALHTLPVRLCAWCMSAGCINTEARPDCVYDSPVPLFVRLPLFPAPSFPAPPPFHTNVRWTIDGTTTL